MRFALRRDELARSWLVEHYRRQGSPPMRTMLAVLVVVIGAALVHRGTTQVGWLTIAWGVILLSRPIVLATFLYFSRRPPANVEVTVDERGVNVAGEKGARLLPWSEITAWGLGSDYLWYEVRQSARAILPFRVIEDRAGLEALFRAHRPR